MADSEINVRVTATTEELSAGLNKATGEVKDFGSGINDLSQRMAAIKPDAFKAVAQEFNAGKIDLDEYRDALIGMGSANSAASKEAVTLAQSAHLSSGGIRELVVVGRELASGNLTRLPGSLSLLATRMNLISPAGILAAAGIAAVGYAIYEAIDSSQKFEAELATIQNSLTAIGEGNRFDRTEITDYLTQLRQIPGVDLEAAESIVGEFTRSRNIGGEMMRQLTADIVPFSELIGKKVPEAAKEMAAAFNDPVKGLALLKSAGVEVSAATQELVTEMMAVNNVAGAQQALLDGISDAMSHMVDNSTGLDRFLHNLGNDFRGVNEQATVTRSVFDALAQQITGLPNFSQHGLLGGGGWTGNQGTVQSGDEKQAAIDKEEQTKKDNDAVGVTNKLFDTGNSQLREQEVHKQNILKIQEGINAAEALGDEQALKRAYADLETENKKYYGEPKQPKAPKAPKDDFDREFEQELADEQKAQEAEIEGNKRVADEKLRTAQAANQQKLALGLITAQEEIQAELEAADKKHAIDDAAFNSMLASEAQGTAAYEKTLADKLVAEEKWQQQVLQLRTKLAQQSQQQDNQLTKSITSGLNQTVSGVLTGTQTMAQAFQRMGQNIVLSVVEGALDKIVTQWVSNSSTIESVQTALNSFLGISNETNAAAAVVAQQTQTHAAILGYAGEGAAAAIASTSAIPIVGPGLAPEAGAAIYADIMSFQVASAAGGMVVGHDQLAMVHENEMILPSHLSQGIAGMIAGGQGGGSGHTFNNTFHVNAGDGVTAKQLPDMIVKTMSKAMRNGQFGGMRT